MTDAPIPMDPRAAADAFFAKRPGWRTHYERPFLQGWDARERAEGGDRTATMFGPFLANTTERNCHEAGWLAASRAAMRRLGH